MTWDCNLQSCLRANKKKLLSQNEQFCKMDFMVIYFISVMLDLLDAKSKPWNDGWKRFKYKDSYPSEKKSHLEMNSTSRTCNLPHWWIGPISSWSITGPQMRRTTGASRCAVQTGCLLCPWAYIVWVCSTSRTPATVAQNQRDWATFGAVQHWRLLETSIPAAQGSRAWFPTDVTSLKFLLFLKNNIPGGKQRIIHL